MANIDLYESEDFPACLHDVQENQNDDSFLEGQFLDFLF